MPGGEGDDHISLDLPTQSQIKGMNENDNMPPWGHSDMEALGNKIELNLESTEKNGFWKYEEDLTMKEIRDYLSGTYKSHYTSQESKTQTLDLIESIGDADPFCRSNAIKYLSRFGKKNGKSKLDILKAIHYCILLYHFSGLHTPLLIDMKLSKQTLAVLNNFSDINQSIYIQAGNKIRTISVMKNILAECQVEEEFTKSFAIYDLPQFLKVIRLYQDPEPDFTEDNYVTIREGRNRSRYFFADPNVIVSPPKSN